MIQREYVSIHAVSFCLILFLAAPAHARIELTYLEGNLHCREEDDDSHARQWEYLQELPEPFAFSLSYLNEGHLDEPDKHHRDGFVLQVWAEKPVLVPWFSLMAGVGPYYWYDTQLDSSGNHEYVRGLGIVSSAAAKIRLPYGGLYVQGRFNWVETRKNIGTTSVFLGIGTDFSSLDVLEKPLPDISEDLRNEVLVLFDNYKRNGAKGIEYRRNLGILHNHVEASLTYLFTSNTLFEEREAYGVSARAWIVNTCGDRLKFGFGGGLFLDLIESPYEASVIVSLLAAFRISNHVNFQVCRSRIPPNHRYDEDIWNLGLGYVF